MAFEKFDRVFISTRDRYGIVTEVKPIGGALAMYRVLLDSENGDHDERLYGSAFVQLAADQRDRPDGPPLFLPAVNNVVPFPRRVRMVAAFGGSPDAA